jgi:hypothetical protein
LSVDDIPFSQRRLRGQAIPTNRITVQYIVNSGGIMVPRFAPNNSELRLPADISKWPPAVILNMVYTSAVLQAWPQKHSDNLLGRWSKTFIMDADDEPGDDAGDEAGDKAGETSGPITKQDEGARHYKFFKD